MIHVRRVLYLMTFVILTGLLMSPGVLCDPGCYDDHGDNRDLPHQANVTNLTRDTCRYECRSLNYSFAGVQNDDEDICFCGNQYGKHGKKPEEDCTKPCEGNDKENCGGKKKNFVMALNPGAGLPGCYSDLENFKKIEKKSYRNSSLCVQWCSSKGYGYAAAGTDGCKCSDTFNSSMYDKVPNANCSEPELSNGYVSVMLAEDVPGCYVDRDFPLRDLPLLLFNSRHNTRVMCRAGCFTRGFPYAAVQNGTECFCGNQYGLYGRVDRSECNSKCMGNLTQNCGGKWRNWIMFTMNYQVIRTKNEYKYIPVHFFSCTNYRRVRVSVKACNSAHIKLMSDIEVDHNETYEIVIGGWNNSRSVIRKKKQQGFVEKSFSGEQLDCKHFKTVYVSWDSGTITVRTADSVLVTYHDPQPYAIHGISVSTGFGATGFWRVYNPVCFPGCYQDDEKKRDLEVKVYTGANNTHSNCVQMCSDRGYGYAGVQRGSHCFCGDTFGRHGPASDCLEKCTGSDEYCGGDQANWIMRAREVPGCFMDNSTRDLPVHLHTDERNIRRNCKGGCFVKGYKYAAVQYGTQCFCGNAYGMYQRRKNSECGMKCPGDSNETCGGNWRNWVMFSSMNFYPFSYLQV